MKRRGIHKPPTCFFNFWEEQRPPSCLALLEELTPPRGQSSKEGGQGTAAHGYSHGLSAPSKVLQLLCQAKVFAQLLVQPVMQ